MTRLALNITAIVFAMLVTFQLLLANASEKQTGISKPPQSQPVSEWVTLAGQIDLRLEEEEGVEDEQDRLAKAGVQYLHLPTGRYVPRVEQVRLFANILNNNPDRPILVHCSSGNREPIRQAIRGYRAGAEE